MTNHSKTYSVELFYGYEESSYGIYHAFETVDEFANRDSDKIAKELAAALDCVDVDEDNVETISDRFNYNSMFIALPEATVARIKADAIREHNERIERMLRNG